MTDLHALSLTARTAVTRAGKLRHWTTRRPCSRQINGAASLRRGVGSSCWRTGFEFAHEMTFTARPHLLKTRDDGRRHSILNQR
jgi:hypothetical protein